MNSQGSGDANIEVLSAAKAAKMPIRKAPLTLTDMVPQGNVSPRRRATKPDRKYRAMPPKALPIATQINPLTTIERPPSALGYRRRSEEHTSELQSRQYLVCR